MRVLCLHGSGASADIMERQIGTSALDRVAQKLAYEADECTSTANLRALLPPSYNFDFLDAPLESEPAHELRGVCPGPYYCFFERYSAEEMKKAVSFVREVVEGDGPYDCVIGFSQGAAVAAAYIAQQQLQGSFEDEPFKIALFMCAALIPPQIATSEELVNTIGSLGPIDIATVHVVGRKDPCDAQSLELVKSCTQATAQVLLNDGGHDVPRDAVSTKNIAAAVERAQRLAFSG